MSKSPLLEKSKEFALETIYACKMLREAKCLERQNAKVR